MYNLENIDEPQMDKSLSAKLDIEEESEDDFEIDSSKFKIIIKQYKSQINDLKETIVEKEK